MFFILFNQTYYLLLEICSNSNRVYSIKIASIIVGRLTSKNNLLINTAYYHINNNSIVLQNELFVIIIL